MTRVLLGARSVAAMVLGLLVAQGAAAQSMGSVSYAPFAASNVPTMSEWALIGMAVVLAAVALYAMRAQNRRVLKMWASGLVACGALSAAFWNRPAVAEPAPVEIALDQPPGGVANIPHSTELFFGDFFHIYTAQNLTDRPQRVTGVSVITGLTLLPPTGFTPECTVGLVLQPNGICYIKVYNDGLPG